MRFCLVIFITAISLSGYAGIFDGVKKENTPLARVNLADSIFQNFFRQHDSTLVLQSLTALNAIASNLNDDLLKCYTLSAFGDYYARIRGFNELSTSYLMQAIKQSKAAGSAVAETVSNYKLGRYYYNFKKYPLAFEYLLRANYMAEGIGHSKALQSGWILFYLAKAYHEIGDFDNAVWYYKVCLQYDTVNDRFKKIVSYSNMASIAKDKQQYAAALQYLALTLSTAQNLKDTVWIGLSKGFIGNILYKQGKYDSAKTYLEAGYSSNIQYNEWANATTCVLDLAAIAMLQNNMPLASHYINAANTCLQHNSTVTGRKKLYEVMVPYYQKQGNTAAAFNAAQQLKLATDSVQQQNNLQDYKNIELRVETEKHLAQLTHLSLKAKNASLKRNAIIAILFLLVLISLIFYRNQRQKRKVDKQLHAKQEALLQSEKLRAEEELRNAHQLLNRYTESIHEKNKLIEEVSAELERLKTTLPIEQTNPEKLVYFDNLLKSTILTSDEWDDFKALFDKVHKGFFFKLKETFSSLSESDTRLLSLIKLQLSNREMANMQGVSIDAIKKAKQRLRKKINLQDDTKSLEDYVVSI